MRVVKWSLEEFLDRRDLWNSTLKESIDNHVFLTWEWLSNWWKHFGTGRGFLLVTVVDGERILAAAPLMISRCPMLGLKVEFVGTPESDYHSFLLTAKAKEPVDMILDYVNQNKPSWNVIELNNVSNCFETAKLLRSASSESMDFKEKEMVGCAYIPLPNDFGDYLRGVDPHFIKDLRRQERRLKENHKVHFRVLTEGELPDNAMEVFFDLHQRRMRSKNLVGIFSDQKVRDFHLDVARSFAEKGWLALSFLMPDSRPVAAQYNFKYSDKMYFYQSGFEPFYSKYSVGSLLNRYLIASSIKWGLKEYDFMRGHESEPYKRRWNTLRRGNLRMLAARKKIIYRAYRSIDLLKRARYK